MADNKIPLIVGVTGHRNLVASEVPLLATKVEQFIERLQQDYPGLPLLFLTGIAEGADSLVAQVASKRGCEVINVLPMQADLYREHISASARPIFNQLLATNETFVLQQPATSDNHPELQYQRLGVFLAGHCHLLLALWDGTNDGGPGGTADVIRFHRHDATTLADSSQHRTTLDIADDESDLVYHIPCSRQSGDSANNSLTAESSACWLSRDDIAPRTIDMPPRYARVLQRMQEFNADAEKFTHERVAEPFVSATGFLALGPWQYHIQRTYDHCDLLATHFQARTLLAMRTTLGSALTAGLAFIIYADFENQNWSLYLYFGLISLALLSFRIAERNGWQRKYVDYRVLAEALRVQYFWALAGISMENPSRFSHDRFFNGRDLDLGWIRNVLRWSGLRADVKPNATASDIELTVKHWVGTKESGQLGYYRKKSSQKLREHQATNRITTACFATGLIAAAVLAVSQGKLPDIAVNTLVALMGLLPLLAAARQNYAHRLAQRELVAQYAQMHKVFEFAARLLEETSDAIQVQEILQDLGDAALNENAQWLLRQRERPIPGGDAFV